MGYFAEVGLDYQFVTRAGPGSAAASAAQPAGGGDSAYLEFLNSSRAANVASTSHWAVDLAASAGHGQLWTQAYSIMPSAIFVPPDSPVEDPEHLAGMEIVVGEHSGSHFSAVHALEHILSPDAVKLRFVAGRATRVKVMLDRQAPAANVYGLESYILAQQGFRNILDSSFLVCFLIVGEPPIDELQKYFEALRLAQRAMDEDPEKHKHHLLEDTPKELRPLLDVRKHGSSERLVFEPYGAELYHRSCEWATTHGIVPADWAGSRRFDEVAVP